MQPSRTYVLCVLVILAGLQGGCSSGAHTVESPPLELSSQASTSSPPAKKPPTYLAPLTCWDTVSCCVEQNPVTAVERCGADPMRVAEVLKALAEVYATLESTPEAEGTQTEAGAVATSTGAQVETAGRVPKWKQKCIMTYVECRNFRWIGNCYDCLRRCEAQRKWPEEMCPDPRKPH